MEITSGEEGPELGVTCILSHRHGLLCLSASLGH